MRLLLSTFVCFALLASGCTDEFIANSPEFAEPGASEQLAAESPDGTNQSKYRNAHLFDRALTSDTAGKFGNQQSLNLIFSLDKQRILERYGVLERYRILERYRLLERYHVLERYEYESVFDGYAITIDDSLGLSEYDDFLAALAADDEILWFEPDFSIATPSPTAETGASGQTVPWSVAAVGGQTSWTSSGNGSGRVDVDVYVLDTGVSNDDIEVEEALDMRAAEGHDDDSADHDGHGTHVAGIIGAVDDDDGLVGIAPGVKIHNLKVLDDNGSTDVSVVIAAVEEITRRKLANPGNPIVVNMSIGENVGTEGYTALDHAVEASSDAGVIYVVSAGNQGDNAGHVTPAKVDDAITVGSYNILGFFSSFSNWGPKVDILAPGEGVVSLAPESAVPVSMSGTSMSAAHVTGAVALYVAQYPAASAVEVRNHLVSTAQEYVVGAPGGTTRKSLWIGGDPTTVSVRVSDDNDDAEEQDGDMDRGSSDLELAFESSSQQTIGIRFRDLGIPQGATITSASIQFTVDETDSGPVSLTIRGEAADNAEAYSSSNYDITSRSTTAASIPWAPAPWNSVGAAGSDQETPDLSPLVQEIVNRAGWSDGNDLAFIITGTGERTAESYDGSSSKAPLLTVEYLVGGQPPAPPPTITPPPVVPPSGGGSLAIAIGARNDDVEEYVSSGSMSRGNADLELADDYSWAGDTQMIGLRFVGLDIPEGATITTAYIQFTAEEVKSGASNLTIEGEAADNPGEYTSSDYNVSSRSRTSASASWSPPSWSSVGDAGAAQRTSDLSGIVQEIVNRGGWSSGNAMALMIHGSGTRTAYSWDNDASKAPVLHVTWQ